MNRGALAAVALVAIVGAAGGGYWLYGQQRCAGHEEDYLNAVSDLQGAAAMRSLGNEPSLRAAAEITERKGRDGTERALTALYDECGKRAAQTAVRKGQQLLLSGL